MDSYSNPMDTGNQGSSEYNESGFDKFGRPVAGAPSSVSNDRMMDQLAAAADMS